MFTGENSLATLHHFLSENFDWLMSLLNVTPLLSASNKSSITLPALSLSQQPPMHSGGSERLREDFNPLNMFASIGHSQFNHVKPLILSSISYMFKIFTSVFSVFLK